MSCEHVIGGRVREDFDAGTANRRCAPRPRRPSVTVARPLSHRLCAIKCARDGPPFLPHTTARVTHVAAIVAPAVLPPSTVAPAPSTSDSPLSLQYGQQTRPPIQQRHHPLRTRHRRTYSPLTGDPRPGVCTLPMRAPNSLRVLTGPAASRTPQPTDHAHANHEHPLSPRISCPLQAPPHACERVQGLSEPSSLGPSEKLYCSR